MNNKPKLRFNALCRLLACHSPYYDTGDGKFELPEQELYFALIALALFDLTSSCEEDAVSASCYFRSDDFRCDLMVLGVHYEVGRKLVSIRLRMPEGE